MASSSLSVTLALPPGNCRGIGKDRKQNKIKNAFFSHVLVYYSRIQSRCLKKHCSMDHLQRQWVSWKTQTFFQVPEWLGHKVSVNSVRNRDGESGPFPPSNSCKDRECTCNCTSLVCFSFNSLPWVVYF